MLPADADFTVTTTDGIHDIVIQSIGSDMANLPIPSSSRDHQRVAQTKQSPSGVGAD